MSWDLVLRHCAAMRASITQQQVGLELIASQLSGLEAYARNEQAKAQQPTATIQVPETCRGYKAEDCARLSEEAVIELGGMGGSQTQLMCRGCGLNPQ